MNQQGRPGSIAIVGIGCRLPGEINSAPAFWDFLCRQRNAITEVPIDRWDSEALFAADAATPGRTYARRGGFLKNIDRFDAEFFGISPREAAHVDPQQRLLLETAVEAMEDAGERWDDRAMRNTGVFVGVFIHDYQHMQFAERTSLGAHTGTGTAMSIAANRVSYVFDFHGPSVAVDTACSSSLVAVDLACKAISNGDCDFALAGGVNVILKPEMTIAMSKANMLSRDGKCKAFDAGADGYVRGEGAGLLLLRRTDIARAAGNRIYAIVRGSGVNSDGKTNGISVPNGDAQAALARRVLAEADVAPSSVGYVEAHGTGTPVGDPIEAGALGRVFSEGRPHDAPLLLGSVKTNIGHLESASGAVGLIKAALCLHHGAIVPNLHFEQPNPAIDFDKLRLRVVREKQDWPVSSGPRRAAVNSFGFGGTNAHLLLEEAPSADDSAAAPVTEGCLRVREAADPVELGGRWVLPMGAHDEGALHALASQYATVLHENAATVRNLVYTVSQRRCHGPHRAALVANDAAELQAKLRELAGGQTPNRAAVGRRNEAFSGRPVFVFTGMGPQWWGMGRELLEQSDVFRQEVERIDERLLRLAGWSLLDRLLDDEGTSLIQKTQVAQPAIFALQAGLVALFRHWGIEPSAVMGHSVGEIAALYAAGFLSLDDAVTVAFQRSRLQSRMEGNGSMLAVGIDRKQAERMLVGLEGSVSIAAINAPDSLTLSGDTAALEQLRARLEAEGKLARRLKVEVPYHSARMDSIREELSDSLREIRPGAGHCPYYSTTDGRTLQSAAGDAAYWWRNVRETVLFASTMDAAIDDGHVCFLEVGPHPVLRASMQECLTKRGAAGIVISTLRRGNSDLERLAVALSELHVIGGQIAWQRVLGTGQLSTLPPYPWQKTRHWAESAEAEERRKGTSDACNLRTARGRHPLLGGRVDLPTPTWLHTFRLSEHAFVGDHKVNGAVVLPGTAYLEMALQTMNELDGEPGASLGEGECLVLGDVEMGRALYVGDDDIRLETTRDGSRWVIHGYSDSDASWVRHASGWCRREQGDASEQRLDLGSIQTRCSKPLPPDYAYRLFRDVGLEYGTAFQAIHELRYGADEALARLAMPAALTDGKDSGAPFLFHPALFDACLHTLFAALNLNGEDSDRRGNIFLPVSAREVRMHRRPTPALWSHACVRARTARHFEADIRVYDEHQRIVATVVGLRCQALEQPSAVAQKREREWMFEYAWESSPRTEPVQNGPQGRWVVLVPDAKHRLVDNMRERGAELVVVTPGNVFARVERDAFRLSPASAAHFRSLVSEMNGFAGVRGVVHAWGAATDESDGDGALWESQIVGAGSLLHLVQAMAEARTTKAPPAGVHPGAQDLPALWIVTAQAEPVDESSPVQLPHSALWGFRRVIANEHPELSSRIVDMDAELESWTALAEELGCSPADDELAFRRGLRHVHRLRRHLPQPPVVEAAKGAASGGRVELAIARTGELKSMKWVRLPTLEVGAHEVEIEVRAAALNFKDVMKAMGLFPARLLEGNLWSRETLGMECAGRVSRVGAQVMHVQPGDEVMALAPRSFASHVVTHGALVCRNPGLAPAEAAGIPVAFLTASVALEHLAHLEPGERVLIHAASGGVGQAAIQIAESLGAEIFATAGSEQKRASVMALGVPSHRIFDSRQLRFADQIRQATNGEGVDVVLNSLAGDAITHGLSVLRDYGRFVELGKMDLDRDFGLGLRPFTRCLSFHAVDLDRMLAQRVDLCGRILCSVAERLADQRLRPLPVTVYRAVHAAAAFADMAAARHLGKLVVDLQGSPPPVEEPASITFRRDASYLVTGGLGGFGKQLALWLARRGAGRLVLAGRRGQETPGAAQTVAEVTALGAEVHIEACDVADAADVRRMLASVPADKPLHGVFHAAAVLDDALIKNLSLERYRKTFEPKAMGAWNLHEQTLSAPLDHFMCFSSMASILGNQGSGNYCAANAFVDALAHHRRRRGLPALTVNWGVIADVGMAADEDFYRQNLERNGLQTIHSRHCLEILALLMDTRRVQTTVCPIGFETWLKFNPAGREGRLRDLWTAGSSEPGVARVQGAEANALHRALESLDHVAQVKLAREAVSGILAEVFRIELAKIDPGRSLSAFGADSLMAIEIKNRLEPLGLAIAVTQLLGRTSVATLADMLLERFGYRANDERGAAPPASAVGESPWFVRQTPNPGAKVRLFCFPYAGGGPGVYHHWPRSLPSWVEVVAIALPGRGGRSGEPNLTSIADTADAIVPAMLPLLDRPFALFGHCMGAILMYEVASRLQTANDLVPLHVFASGCMAPHLYNSPIVHEQDDAAFLDVLRLISFSGTRALIENEELRRSMFPLLRGDFRAVVEYGDSFHARPALRAPITGLAAENDLFAAPKAMQAWGRYTSAGYDLAQLPGDHYFIESDRETVTKIVAERLSTNGEASTAALAPANVKWMKPDNTRLGIAPHASNGEGGALAAIRAQPPQLGLRAPNRSVPVSPRDVRGSLGIFAAGPLRVLCFPPAGVLARETPLPSGLDHAHFFVVDWRNPKAEAGIRPCVDDMVSRVYDVVRPHLAAPTIFVGHCLGAVVAYELALRIRRDGLPVPEHLLVTGAVGPHLYVAPDAQKLPDDKLLELLAVLHYPFVDRLRDDPAFCHERLPIIRTDLEAMASYQYEETSPLGTPITAVAMRHDLWSYPLRTDSWTAHTSEQCEVVQWDGDHYAAFRSPQRLQELVRSLPSVQLRRGQVHIEVPTPRAVVTQEIQ